jgi:hypothetical protein
MWCVVTCRSVWIRCDRNEIRYGSSLVEVLKVRSIPWTRFFQGLMRSAWISCTLFTNAFRGGNFSVKQYEGGESSAAGI